MKKWQLASVIAAVTLAAVFAPCPAFTLRAQPRLTEAQAAALQPTPPSLVPGWGTFWSVSRPENPPLPFDNHPDLPVYRLPDGSYLVDDSTVQLPLPPPTNVVAAARNSLIESTLASQRQLLSLLANQVMQLDDNDSTNSPPEGDPCPPQLVDTNSVPDFGTFWFMTRTNDPPLPFDPCTGCDVYLLCDGSYLVDDTSYVWPQPNGDDDGGIQQTNQYFYVSGDFWLEITGVTNSLANLILHGTTAGAPYTILSRQTLTPDAPWDAEAPLIGATGQDWTPIQIPTFDRPVLYFQAMVGSATPQRLWLCAVGITNDWFNCVLRGTTEGVNYDLRSMSSLSSVNNWASETNFTGASGQFWTPVSVPMSGRQSLFLSARSWVDSNGTGIPDWWLLRYFATTDIDPYTLCPSGDGWTILQAYQHGWNPHDWHTPPAPTGLTVKYYGPSNNVAVTWNPSPGLVTGYTVGRCLPYWVTTNYLPLLTQTSMLDALPAGSSDPNFPAAYQVRAEYAGGSSSWSAPVSIYAPDLCLELVSGGGEFFWGLDYIAATTANASVVRGPQGHLYLVTGQVPPSVASLRIWATPDYGDHAYAAQYPSLPEGNYLWESPHILTNMVGSNYWQVSASALQGGFCELPPSLVPSYGTYDLTVQTVATDGRESDCRPIYGYLQDDWTWQTGAVPFLDGRRHIQQNIEFQLRAAQARHIGTDPQYPLETNQFPFTVAQSACIDSQVRIYDESAFVSYVTAGFHLAYEIGNYDWGVAGSQLVLDAFRPFEQNYFYANWLSSGPPWGTVPFGDVSRCSPVGYDTPLGVPHFRYDLHSPMEVDQPYSQFSAWGYASAAATNPIPAILTTNAAQWISTPEFDSWALDLYGGDWETNRWFSEHRNYTVYADFPNLYGLGLRSVKTINWNPFSGPTGQVLVAYPGDTIPGSYFACFFEVERPQLSTVGYYFARSRAAWTPYPDGYGGTNWVATNLDPRPGEPGFMSSATTPIMITSVGQPLFVAAWAKQALVNGFTNVFAYPEQYFEGAYTMNASGNVTTTSAGLLSPYGEFFPMQPGPVALVTMPDIDTGQRGTGVVNVIKLQTDVNHDGIMDLSFGGPDNTSQARPMALWVNNDFDRWHDFYEPDWNQVHDQEEDDLVSAGSPGTVGVTPDCDYQWASGAYAIPSKRDLEDYTRLWIPGMKQLYEAHTNLSFELSIRNNDTADGPAINLVLAVESDGGTRYLTDTNVANDQISLPSGKCIGRISPYNTIRLNDFFQLALYPGTGAEHFIWCGARRGKGELVLQVKQGTNLLAETSLWLDLKDIKEMYERWTVGDNGSKPPTNTAYRALEDLPVGVMAFQYGPLEATNTPYILHVHGWNMSRYDKDRYAETAFKRLYWQGYQGRFGEFRWPTKTGFTTFDASEFNAWKSGEGLYRLITNLNATYPGRVYLTAHSMGNIVAAEALRKAGASQIVNTYIGMQAAIASHAYDPTTTNRSLGILDSFTYDRHAEYWTNGAPCYLNGVQGASHFANFFNPRDWALSWWETDQDTKPDMGYSWVNVPNDNERYYYQSSPYNTRQLYFPQDTYEIFSFVTEARCYAVGAQTNVAGSFTLSAQVDLDAAPYSFGELHKGHSGEFRSTNMDRWPFWERVLFTMGLKAAQ